MIYTKDYFSGIDSVDIGDFTYGTINVVGIGQAKLTVGKFCSIGDLVTVFMGNEHRTDWISTYPFSDPSVPEWGALQIYGHPTTKGNVTIGNDVWIGQGVTILSGVTIHDGACIGACSVVAKDVPAYIIVAGNPIRAIRSRFSAEIVRLLLELKWWDWPLEKIRDNIRIIMSPPNTETLRRLL